MLAWAKQNTMQRAMWTVLEWAQSHAKATIINMITNKFEPQQKHRHGTISKNYLGSETGFTDSNLALGFSRGSKHTVVQFA